MSVISIHLYNREGWGLGNMCCAVFGHADSVVDRVDSNSYVCGHGGHMNREERGDRVDSISYATVLIKYEVRDAPCFSFNLGSKSVLFL